MFKVTFSPPSHALYFHANDHFNDGKSIFLAHLHFLLDSFQADATRLPSSQYWFLF